MRKIIYPIVVMTIVFSFAGCAAKVRTTAMSEFKIDKYLGTWYEVARMDYKFEKNMDSVTATYSINPKGRVDVLNRGFNTKTGEWEEAHGEAKSTNIPNYFKVYFTPMIGAAYRVAYIDNDYSMAVVTGKTHKYIWILSRTPQLENDKMKVAIEVAKDLGYDSSKLLYPKQ